MITNFEFRPMRHGWEKQVQQFHVKQNLYSVVFCGTLRSMEWIVDWIQYDIFEEESGFFSDTWLEQLVAGKHYRTLILFEKGKPDIVAISVFQTYGYIYSFGVDKNYRRLGLGKFILKCTIENMVDMQLMEASLNVNTNNDAAVTLYRSCGFCIDYDQIEGLKGFYGDDDPMGPDAYYMEMVLPQRQSYTKSDRTDEEIWRKLNVKEWNLIQRVNGLLVAIDLFCNW